MFRVRICGILKLSLLEKAGLIEQASEQEVYE
jgi:hypothetical protein